MTDADRPESLFVQNVTAVDGFAYGVIGADLHVIPDRGPVYLLAGHRPPQEADSDWLVAQPSRMLNARYAVVDFTGRETEQAKLTAWLRTGSRLAARWLHAPGGQGKTRLAAELAVQATAAGWKVAVATHGPGAVHPPPGSQDLRPDDAAGLLLLVDYADRWPLTHLTWLFSNALFHRQVPARLLLLARSAQPWPALRSTLEDQADVSDQLLPPLPTGTAADERAVMFAAARKNFAARYGIIDPAVIAQISPPSPLEPGAFGITLAVHTAALVAVDAYARRIRPPEDPAALTAYLLDRERRAWARLYENRLEGLDFHTPPSVMARTVFTAALSGPADHRRGREILTRLGVEGHPHRLLSDHAACYPPAAADSVLEPLYPDRLAEDFLALSLPGHTLTAYPADPWSAAGTADLASRDDEGSPPPYIARTMTFLAAAAGRWTHVSAYLNTLLARDPSLAIAAGGAALTAFTEVIDMEVLEAIEAYLPSDRHVDLDPAAAAITIRLHEHRLASATDDDERATLHTLLGYRLANASRYEEALAATGEAAGIYRRLAAAQSDAFEPDLARTLENVSTLFSRLGRPEEALAAAGEAAESWRRLAAARPAVFEPDLAGALTNLSGKLSTVGRPEDALAAAAEAAEIYRRLAAARPDALEPDLARALSNLGVMLSGLGRPEEALAATVEAAESWRRLAAAWPAVFEPDLAGSLSNLGMMLSGLGRPEEAVAPAAEAAEIGRRLAAARPDAFEPQLATALTNLGLWLWEVGRPEEAVAPAAEAAEIYRRLAAARPDAFEPDLAGALTNLAIILAALGRPEEALAATEEAAVIRRRLTAARPAVFEPDLAESLSNLGMMLSGLGRPEEAVAPAGEGAEIYRRLAAARPAVFEPHLATALNTLGVVLAEVRRPEEALAATEEAAVIRRRLAAARPAVFEPDLAGSLSNLGMMLSGLGRPEEAVAPAGEGAEIYRRLAAARPAVFEPHLATALNNFGVRLLEAGRVEEALAPAAEAAEIRRRLAAAQPSVFEPLLATALSDLGTLLAEAGRPEEALAPAAEAAEIRRRLAAAWPGMFEPDLAMSLSNLGVMLSGLGRPEEALAATDEAAEIYRRLAAARPGAFEHDLARSLWGYAKVRAAGKADLTQALTAAEEAVTRYETLANHRPLIFTNDLAGALTTLADVLDGLDRAAPAAAARRQAEELVPT